MKRKLPGTIFSQSFSVEFFTYDNILITTKNDVLINFPKMHITCDCGFA